MRPQTITTAFTFKDGDKAARHAEARNATISTVRAFEANYGLAAGTLGAPDEYVVHTAYGALVYAQQVITGLLPVENFRFKA